MNIKSYIPILDWLSNYNKKWLKGDVSAGLTVGVMLIPQGMAYAYIAGLPPVYGLYAAIVPLIVYAIFGTSRQLAVGPVAMVSLLTVTAISSFEGLSVNQYISYAILLAFLVGVIQFLLGLFKLGFIVNFLSHPVISGFTSAVALIIGFGQLKNLLDIQIERTHYVHEIVVNVFNRFDEINAISFAIGLFGIIIILGIKRINKSLPGQIMAVIFGILVVFIFGLGEGENSVSIIREIPNQLPKFEIPVFNIHIIEKLLPLALSICLLSFMESIAVAKAIQRKHRDYKIIPNQELVALGLANIIGSFFQSYTSAGGFGRTAVNDQAGAKTGMAALISVSLIIITLLFLTPLFYNLPNAILAAVIIVAVSGLINYKEAIHLYKSNRTDFWMLISTFISTLVFGVEIGIGVGVLLSLAMVLFRTTMPHTAELARIPNTHFYRNIKRFDNLDLKDDILIYRFDAQLFFANTEYFKDKLYEFERSKENKLKLLVIDGESINNIDSTAIQAFEEILADFTSREIELFFTGIKGPVRDKLNASGFTNKISENHFFLSIQDAVDCFEAKQKNKQVQNKYQEYTQQVNK